MILCGVVFFSSSLPYVTISNEEISFRKVFSVKIHRYAWDDINRYIYYETKPGDQKRAHYEFYFSDGSILSIPHTGLFTDEVQNKIHKKIRTLDIELERMY